MIRLYEVFNTTARPDRWYWRTRDPHNLQITGVGGEPYVSASNARRALRRQYGPDILIETIRAARVFELPPAGTQDEGGETFVVVPPQKESEESSGKG